MIVMRGSSIEPVSQDRIEEVCCNCLSFLDAVAQTPVQCAHARTENVQVFQADIAALRAELEALNNSALIHRANRTGVNGWGKDENAPSEPEIIELLIDAHGAKHDYAQLQNFIKYLGRNTISKHGDNDGVLCSFLINDLHYSACLNQTDVLSDSFSRFPHRKARHSRCAALYVGGVGLLRSQEYGRLRAGYCGRESRRILPCLPRSVSLAANNHNYIGHEYIDHNYVGHNYIP